MRLTSKGRYAVRAILDLSLSSHGRPVRLQEISERQSISLHYLEQLFRKLRNGRVVNSVRGPGGGYVLARTADEISLLSILESVGENSDPARDFTGGADESVDTLENTLTRTTFATMGQMMNQFLAETTIGTMVRRARGEAQVAPESSTRVRSGSVGDSVTIGESTSSRVNDAERGIS